MNKSIVLILVLLGVLIICVLGIIINTSNPNNAINSNNTSDSNNNVIPTQSYLNIHISSDGSISGIEGTPQVIQRTGDTYLLKSSINGSILAQKDNITIDGANYSIQGDGSSTGVQIKAMSVVVKNLQIKHCQTGMRISTSENTIVGCEITNCTYGIYLSSSKNTFSNNYLHNNTIGIDFVYAQNNFFTYNRLENNGNPIHVENDWINSIDSSNTIDAKPIYYFINQQDLTINPTDYPKIGYLAFVNCAQITVRNLDFSGSRMGIIMVYTTNSTITQNKITNTWRGIYLYGSYGNNITENYLANNQVGIYVETNNANTITRNDIRNSKEFGIVLEGANQIIYHNDFINNSKHATSNGWYDITSAPLPWGVHIWDNGSVGNYWSDYNGTDSDHDGIGDVPYVLSQERGRNNVDNYPLISPLVKYD